MERLLHISKVPRQNTLVGLGYGQLLSRGKIFGADSGISRYGWSGVAPRATPANPSKILYGAHSQLQRMALFRRQGIRGSFCLRAVLTKTCTNNLGEAPRANMAKTKTTVKPRGKANTCNPSRHNCRADRTECPNKWAWAQAQLAEKLLSPAGHRQLAILENAVSTCRLRSLREASVFRVFGPFFQERSSTSVRIARSELRAPTRGENTTKCRVFVDSQVQYFLTQLYRHASVLKCTDGQLQGRQNFEGAQYPAATPGRTKKTHKSLCLFNTQVPETLRSP